MERRLSLLKEFADRYRAVILFIAVLEKDYDSALAYLERASEFDPQNKVIRSSVLELRRLINPRKCGTDRNLLLPMLQA